MRLRRATTLMSLLLATALVAVGAPASAATETFVDAKGDAPFDVDIQKVKVVHGKKAVRIVLRVDALFYGEGGDLYDTSIFVDTRKSSSGPEYMVGTGGFHYVYFKMRGWKFIPADDDPFGDIACGWKLSYKPSMDTVTYRVPTRCLGNPKRLRVNVMTGMSDSNGKALRSDKSPAYRKFHGWVRRG